MDDLESDIPPPVGAKPVDVNLGAASSVPPPVGAKPVDAAPAPVAPAMSEPDRKRVEWQGQYARALEDPTAPLPDTTNLDMLFGGDTRTAKRYLERQIETGALKGPTLEKAKELVAAGDDESRVGLARVVAFNSALAEAGKRPEATEEQNQLFLSGFMDAARDMYRSGVDIADYVAGGESANLTASQRFMMADAYEHAKIQDQTFTEAYEGIVRGQDVLSVIEKKKAEGWSDDRLNALLGFTDYIKSDPEMMRGVSLERVTREREDFFKSMGPVLGPVASGFETGGRGVWNAMQRLSEGFHWINAKTYRMIGADASADWAEDVYEIAKRQARDFYDVTNAFSEGMNRAVGDDAVPDILQRGLSGAISSTVEAGATVVLGPQAMIPALAANAGHRALYEGADAGLQGKDLWAYAGKTAAIEGLITYAFGKFGGGKAGGFESRIFGKGIGLGVSEFLVDAGWEILEEETVELLQYANDIFSEVNEGFSWSEASSMVAETFISTAFMTGFTAYKGNPDGKKAKQFMKIMAPSMLDMGLTQEQIDKTFRDSAKASENIDQFVDSVGAVIGEAMVRSPNFLVDWAGQNVEAAKALAGLDHVPSRKEFTDAGLPLVPVRVRNEVQGILQEMAKTQDMAEVQARAEQRRAKYQHDAELADRLGVKTMPTLEDAALMQSEVAQPPLTLSDADAAMVAETQAQEAAVAAASEQDVETLTGEREAVAAAQFADEMKTLADDADAAAGFDQNVRGAGKKVTIEKLAAVREKMVAEKTWMFKGKASKEVDAVERKLKERTRELQKKNLSDFDHPLSFVLTKLVPSQTDARKQLGVRVAKRGIYFDKAEIVKDTYDSLPDFLKADPASMGLIPSQYAYNLEDIAEAIEEEGIDVSRYLPKERGRDSRGRLSAEDVVFMLSDIGSRPDAKNKIISEILMEERKEMWREPVDATRAMLGDQPADEMFYRFENAEATDPGFIVETNEMLDGDIVKKDGKLWMVVSLGDGVKYLRDNDGETVKVEKGAMQVDGMIPTEHELYDDFVDEARVGKMGVVADVADTAQEATPAPAPAPVSGDTEVASETPAPSPVVQDLSAEAQSEWQQAVAKLKAKVGEGRARDGSAADELTAEQTDEAKRIIREILGDAVDVAVVDKLATKAGARALGLYQDGFIALAKGGEMADTARHESVHAAVDLFLTAEEAQQLRDAMRQDGDTDYQAEERLAEAFIQYAKDRTGLKGRVRMLVAKVLRGLRALAGREGAMDSVNAFYDRMLGGEFRAAEPVGSDVQTAQAGRVIPLSERFNPAKDDIRYRIDGEDRIAQEIESLTEEQAASTSRQLAALVDKAYERGDFQAAEDLDALLAHLIDTHAEAERGILDEPDFTPRPNQYDILEQSEESPGSLSELMQQNVQDLKNAERQLMSERQIADNIWGNVNLTTEGEIKPRSAFTDQELIQFAKEFSTGGRRGVRYRIDGEAIAIAGELADILIRNGKTSFAAYAAAVKNELGPAWSEVKASLYGAWMAAAGQHDGVETVGRAQAQSVLSELDAGRDPTAPAMQVRAEPGQAPTGPDGEHLYGIKEAFVQPKREQLGKPPTKVKETRTREMVMEEANAVPPVERANLVDELFTSPRPLRDTEYGVLLLETAEREKALDRAMRTRNGRQDEALVKAEQAALAAYERIMDVVATGANQSKTMNAQGLAFLRTVLDESYTPVSLQRKMQAKKGQSLSEAEMADANRISEEYSKLNKEKAPIEEAVKAEMTRVEELSKKYQAEADFWKLQAEITGQELAKRKHSKADAEKVIEEAQEKIKAHLQFFAKPPAQMNMKMVPSMAAIEHAGGLLYEEMRLLRAKLTVKGLEIAEKAENLGKKLKEILATAAPFYDFKDEHIDQAVAEAQRLAREAVQEMGAEPMPTGQTEKRLPGRVAPKKGEAASDEVNEDQMRKDVKDLIRGEILKGVTDSEVALDNVTAYLQGFMDITRNEVMDYFVDYGKTFKMDPNPMKKAMRQMRREIKVLADIERVLRNEMPIKARQMDQASPFERGKRRELQRLMKNAKFSPEEVENAMRTANQRIQRYYENRISEMEAAMKTHAPMTQNRAPVEYDAKSMELRNEYERVKAEYNEAFPQQRAERTPEEVLEATKQGLRRRLADLNEQLSEGRKRKAGKKPKLNDEEADSLRNQIAAVNNALNDLPGEAELRDAQMRDRYVEKLKDRIAALDRQIDAGARDIRMGRKEYNDSKVTELQAEIEARRAVLDEVAPRQLTEEERFANMERAMARRIEALEQDLRDIKSGKVIEPALKLLPVNQRTQMIKDRIDALKEEKKQLLEARSPGLAAAVAKRKRMEAMLRRLDQRLANKDFAPHSPADVDLTLDPDGVRIEVALAKKRIEFAKAAEAARFNALSKSEQNKEKALLYFMNALEATRALKLSFDNSAHLNQLAKIALSHPLIASEALRQSFRAMSSSYQSELQYRDITKYPLFANGVMKKAGLAIGATDGTGNFRQVDDVNIFYAIPGIPASGRAMGTALNFARASLFTLLLDRTKMGRGIAAKNGKNLTTKELTHIKDIAFGVNAMTGTVNLNTGKVAGKMFMALKFQVATAADAFWVPALRAALWHGDMSAARVLATENVKDFAIYSMMFAIANLVSAMRDDDDEREEDVSFMDAILGVDMNEINPWNLTSRNSMNPLRSDGARVKLYDGRQNWDVMGGRGRIMRFAAQMLAGWKKIGDDYVPLRDNNRLFAPEDQLDPEMQASFGREASNEAGRFALSMLHPWVSAAARGVAEQNFFGINTPWWMILGESIAPLSASEMKKAFSLAKSTDEKLISAFTLHLGMRSSPDYNSRQFLQMQYYYENEFNVEVQKRLYMGMNPKATGSQRQRGLSAIEGLSEEDAVEVLQAEFRRRNGDDWLPKIWPSDRATDRTAYGDRLFELKQAYKEAEAQMKRREERKNRKREKAVESASERGGMG
jgi:hypothetical protein